MSSNSWDNMEICLVVEFNVFPSNKKREKCVYMNIHYYVTKPQLFKIKLLNRIIVIKEFLKQLIDCCLL
jgi:hypothetical protein